MPIQKIQAGRVLNVTVENFVAQHGTIFYDEDIGQLRLGDGITPGGTIITSGGGGGPVVPATTTTLGGIKIGPDFYMDALSVLYINIDSLKNYFYTKAEVDAIIASIGAITVIDWGYLTIPVATTLDWGNITDLPTTSNDWGTILV